MRGAVVANGANKLLNAAPPTIPVVHVKFVHVTSWQIVEPVTFIPPLVAIKVDAVIAPVVVMPPVKLTPEDVM